MALDAALLRRTRRPDPHRPGHHPRIPHWLVGKGRHEEALDILKKTIGEGATLDGITADHPNAAKLSTAQAFKLVLTGGYLHRVIFISIFWTCTIVTLFSIYAFGPQILTLFNLQSGDEANIGYGLINLFFLVGNVVALLVVDKLGRRPVLIWGFILSGVGLLFLALFPHAAPGPDCTGLRLLRHLQRRPVDPGTDLPQ